MRPDLIVPLAMFGAVAVIGGGVVLANRIITRRRTRAYETLCMERGWRFDPERPGEEARHTATCRIFAEGHNRRWTFTVAGKTGGAPFTAFEYRWITGSGKNAQRHRIGGLLWTLERSIPQFFLTPERLWDRIAAHFGGQDIDFDESPGFSRGYRLRAATRPPSAPCSHPRAASASSSSPTSVSPAPAASSCGGRMAPSRPPTPSTTSSCGASAYAASSPMTNAITDLPVA